MSTQITAKTREIVWERCNRVCEVCAAARAAELSHRRPRGMGGTSLLEQHLPSWLIAACHDCHQGPRGIERDRERALEMGWLLRPSDEARRTPAWLETWIGQGWHLIDDFGFYSFLGRERPATSDDGTTIETVTL